MFHTIGNAYRRFGIAFSSRESAQPFMVAHRADPYQYDLDGERISDHRDADRLIDEAGVTTRQTVVTPAIHDAWAARKIESETLDADGDPPLACARQHIAGQRTTSRAGGGQPSEGRQGFTATRHSHDGDDLNDGGEMNDADATRFRAMVAHCNRLGGNRPDL